MNKRDLVIAASQRSGLTQKQIYSNLGPILESILDALAKGEKICLHNFGTFYIKDVPEHPSRNPKSGERIIVPAKKVIRFRPTPEVDLK